jgi:hypothetical protein
VSLVNKARKERLVLKATKENKVKRVSLVKKAQTA